RLALAGGALDRLRHGPGALGGGAGSAVADGGHDQAAGEERHEEDPRPAGAAQVLHDASASPSSSSSSRWSPSLSETCACSRGAPGASAVAPPSVLSSTVPSGARRYDSGAPVTPYSSAVRPSGSRTTGHSPPYSAKNSRTCWGRLSN